MRSDLFENPRKCLRKKNKEKTESQPGRRKHLFSVKFAFNNNTPSTFFFSLSQFSLDFSFIFPGRTQTAQQAATLGEK